MLMKFRLPVKVSIVKHTVRGMIAREQIACVGNPQYGVQSQPIGFEAVAKACEMAGYAVNNPKLVERRLPGALNHPGTSVVQAVVDLARIIHDGSSRNRAVAKQAIPDERPARSMHIARACPIGFTGSSCRMIPPHTAGSPYDKSMQIQRCLETLRVGVRGETDEDYVIPLSNGPRVHTVGKALGN